MKQIIEDKTSFSGLTLLLSFAFVACDGDNKDNPTPTPQLLQPQAWSINHSQVTSLRMPKLEPGSYVLTGKVNVKAGAYLSLSLLVPPSRRSKALTNISWWSKVVKIYIQWYR